MATALDFEKPILEIQEKIEELKKMSLESGMDLNKDIEILEHWLVLFSFQIKKQPLAVS